MNKTSESSPSRKKNSSDCDLGNEGPLDDCRMGRKERWLTNGRSLYGHSVRWLQDVFSVKGFWVLLPAFATLGIAYLGDSLEWPIKNKGFNENLAIYVLSICTLVFVIRLSISRNVLDVLLTIMSANFLCREIHFAGTTKGVYIVAAVVLIVGIVQQKRIFEILSESFLQRILLFGTAWTYFFALLIQRRFFKARAIFGYIEFLPREREMCIILEETMGNTAHSLFLLLGLALLASSVLGWLKNRKEAGAGRKPLENS